MSILITLDELVTLLNIAIKILFCLGQKGQVSSLSLE